MQCDVRNWNLVGIIVIASVWSVDCILMCFNFFCCHILHFIAVKYPVV